MADAIATKMDGSDNHKVKPKKTRKETPEGIVEESPVFPRDETIGKIKVHRR